jgi:hypothetical protein
MRARLAIRFLRAWALIALPLFLAAGTPLWPAGHLFVLTFLGLSIAISLMLLRRDPALLQERMKGLYQPGQPW